MTTKKSSQEESNNTSSGTLRQKRKKETSDCSALSVTLPEPSSTEIALTEQERLSALVMRSYCRFGMGFFYRRFTSHGVHRRICDNNVLCFSFR